MINISPVTLNSETNYIDIKKQYNTSQETDIENFQALLLKEIYLKNILPSSKINISEDDQEEEKLLTGEEEKSINDEILEDVLAKELARQDIFGLKDVLKRKGIYNEK